MVTAREDEIFERIPTIFDGPEETLACSNRFYPLTFRRIADNSKRVGNGSVYLYTILEGMLCSSSVFQRFITTVRPVL